MPNIQQCSVMVARDRFASKRFEMRREKRGEKENKERVLVDVFNYKRLQVIEIRNLSFLRVFGI